ncbi:MAG: heparan-alpha-glucosaminide N-acetyltransferase [Sulfuriferula sp.]
MPLAKNRLLLVDATRGAAVVLMVFYHFCFDLNYFGLIHQDFNDSPFWLTLRAVIVTCFLTLVGISLVLAAAKSTHSYWIRIGKLFAASVAVTAGSYLMFPLSFIFFGILHFIVAASLIARLFLRFFWFNLALGSAIAVFGIVYSNTLFDKPWLQWIGLMTYKPVTEDYVPLFPWLGVVFIGLFLGKLFFRTKLREAIPALKLKKQDLNPPTLWVNSPAWLGRHSLTIYLLHQPLLIGILYLLFGH